MRTSWLWTITLIVTVVTAHQQFCKCLCGENQVIKAIEKCGLCNEEWCLQQNNQLCPLESNEDILISCFQIESTKELWIVMLYVIGVGVLIALPFVRSARNAARNATRHS